VLEDLVGPVSGEEGQGVDPNQLSEVYVHPAMTESNYIVAAKPGVSDFPGPSCRSGPCSNVLLKPYVAEHSHNMFAKLGARMAFLGIDARTEVNRPGSGYVAAS
jgi:hypothetical protein